MRAARRALGETIQTLLIALALALFIRAFIVESFVVEGGSMLPTLEEGERLFVNKLIYRLRAPERGEIVVFAYPGDTRVDYIKRVIAVPGDVVSIQNGTVHLNGEALDETAQTIPGESDYPETRIPENNYFVLGDNRPSSMDSRAFGLVPKNLLRGKAQVVWWPLSMAKLLP